MKRSKGGLAKIPLIGDMLFSMLSLPLVLSVQDIASHTPDNPDVYDVYTLFPAALLFMGIARLFRAFRYRRKNRFQFIRYLVFGIALMACLPLGIALDETKNTLLVLVTVYWGLLAAGCVVSIICDHSLRNLLLNLLALFLLGIFYYGFVSENAIDDFILVARFIAMVQALLSIMTVAFARINLRVLANVIRESYATEVLLGLVLLIVSFSYCLKSWEPAITSLGDGIWYCFAIVTTIGFGDIAATTILGRIVSIILGMYGIVVVSLITSIIVNFYGEMKREKEEEGK